MNTIKFVKMPGEIKEFGIEENTTVAQLLDLAGEVVDNEMEIRGDGESVTLNEVVNGYNLISVTKRLKGAAH